ncbi:MAG TPA: hypothetical protein VG722_12230 [Tepidisphaeraceae bacterium]|nr:hypothetical protein [Tepidisphaeraceae bacterium]
MYRLRSLVALMIVACSAIVLGQQHEIETPTLSGPGFSVTVSSCGGFVIRSGDDRWKVDSSFSFPGKAIGYNDLATSRSAGAAPWQPDVSSDKNNAIIVKALGRPYYSILRTITIHNNRLDIHDTLTNICHQDVGVLIKHTISAVQLTSPAFICGVPQQHGDVSSNPTVFASQKSSHIGAIAEDNIFRVQFEAETSSNQVALGLNHLAIRPGASVTLDWAIYMFPGRDDYWTFINQVRRDWDVNYTIPGPENWFNVFREPYVTILPDLSKLEAYLKRDAVKVVLTAPWVDYENMNEQTGQLVLRPEYKQVMQKVRQELKTADGKIRVVGSIEAPFVSLPNDVSNDLLALVPKDKPQGDYEMSDEMFAVFKAHTDAWKRWGDSVVWSKHGRPFYELYYRGRALISLIVRPILGNGQHKFLMNQANFVLNDVGLDGLYIDSFVGAKNWLYGYSYGKWDGATVDIDPQTGQITNRYTDYALAGIGSRKELIKYVLKQGKIVVTNDYPVSRDVQSLRAIHFTEEDSAFTRELNWPDGQEPPASELISSGQLSTPLLLGIRPDIYEHGNDNYAHTLMKGIIALLRHGMVYYDYQTDIPETGAGSGEYGPLNHMFPITPVELHEGWIIGKERIITAVSGNYVWNHRKAPLVLVYDMSGRPIPAHAEIHQSNQQWTIKLDIRNWASIAVIE